MATTTVAFMLNVGQALGVGVGGTIAQNRCDSLVHDTLQISLCRTRPFTEKSPRRALAHFLSSAQLVPMCHS